MKLYACLPVLAYVTLSFGVQSLSAQSPAAQSPAAQSPTQPAAEHLGTVSFSTSCAPAQQAAFNRGVALLDDFWYDEAKNQFTAVAKADPSCAMAYWGEAMSDFQQIWDRADEATRAKGWDSLKAAPPAKTERERAYLAALTIYYTPDKRPYQQRIEQYSAAMGKLYAAYPDDVDAGAFYALSLLAEQAPDDATLTANRQAMVVLTPLFAKAPDNPGVDHYIIHACDTPALAKDGLAAAEHYGALASSAPHAVHMPGHIFARLGMWQDDITVDEASVHASEQAEAHHQSGAFDQLHADDFLLYAYLQAGQDAKAQQIVTHASTLMTGFESMGGGMDGMSGMFTYYRVELPMIYAMERRDWKALAALEVPAKAKPQITAFVAWTHAVAAGHMHQPAQAQKALAALDAQMDLIRKGRNPEDASSVSAQIRRGQAQAWVAYAGGHNDEAYRLMRVAAELQDQVGQGEVDIPAREMLADMLLEQHKPQQALAEYRQALMLSPGRFNGLYHAGMAAEETGDKAAASGYYAQLLRQTNNGGESSRPELAHARSVTAAAQVAAR